MITPQKLIYSAWQNTDKPVMYMTKDAKGNTIGKKVDFADPEENRHFDRDYKGLCNLCGRESNGGFPVKKVFSAKYMDWPVHKEPGATHICINCMFCLGMNPEGRVALFRYPVFATEDRLWLCNRAQFRDFLVDPPEPPFVAVLPTSQKKHLFSKAKVSYSRDDYFCNLEETVMQVNREEFKKELETIEALRGAGITVAAVNRGEIPGNIFKKYDVYSLNRLVEIMDQVKENRMFLLAAEVAGKMETEEAVCFLGLELMTR